MDHDVLIQRSQALLGFMSPVEAVGVLADAGIPVEDAFLAVKAAEILERPVVLPASAEEPCEESDEDYLARHIWDDGDYMDRKAARYATV